MIIEHIVRSNTRTQTTYPGLTMQLYTQPPSGLSQTEEVSASVQKVLPNNNTLLSIPDKASDFSHPHL